MRTIGILAAVVGAAVMGLIAAAAGDAEGGEEMARHWSAEGARECREEPPWPVGCTFVASAAVNDGGVPAAAGAAAKGPAARPIDLSAIPSPIVLRGDASQAYRDPAAIYHNGVFHLYYTLVKIEEGKPYSYTAWSKSLGNSGDVIRACGTPKTRRTPVSRPRNSPAADLHPQGPEPELLQSRQRHPLRERVDSLPSDLPASGLATASPWRAGRGEVRQQHGCASGSCAARTWSTGARRSCCASRAPTCRGRRWVA